MNHRIKPNNYPRIGYNGIFIFFLNLFCRITLSTMHIETIDAKKHISTMATMDIIVTSIQAKNNGFMVFLIDDINQLKLQMRQSICKRKMLITFGSLTISLWSFITLWIIWRTWNTWIKWIFTMESTHWFWIKLIHHNDIIIIFVLGYIPTTFT